MPRHSRPFKQYRIVYGVQGEGRGHATRSLQMIRTLENEGHLILVLTGGDALTVFQGAGIEVVAIPILRYQYREKCGLDLWKTIAINFKQALGLIFRRGKSYRKVNSCINDFKPELFISDFEPYTSRIARQSGSPLVAIDHQHFLTETLLPRPKHWGKSMALYLYRFAILVFGGHPDYIIASSFWHFPKRPRSRALLVGPFIDSSIMQCQMAAPSSAEIETQLCVSVVYLKRASYLSQLLPALVSRPDIQFEVFSDWPQRVTQPQLPGHIRLHGIHRQQFLKTLSESQCLVTTAGNQVIGEAIYLGKPVLAFPEPDIMEQELNALALEQSGMGATCEMHQLNPAKLAEFMHNLPMYQQNLQRLKKTHQPYDGRQASLQMLQRLIQIRQRGRIRAMPYSPFLILGSWTFHWPKRVNRANPSSLVG